jgi:hypothetical protein
VIGENLSSKFSFSPDQGLKEEKHAQDFRWPWGQHTTKNLEILAAAGIQWWSSYDPDDPATAPINDDVTDWLKSTYSLSDNLATSMATILRADGLPPGRRPRSEES